MIQPSALAYKLPPDLDDPAISLATNPDPHDPAISPSFTDPDPERSSHLQQTTDLPTHIHDAVLSAKKQANPDPQ